MDLDKIEELIGVLETSRTGELSVRKGEIAVHIRRAAKAHPAAPSRRQARPAPERPAVPEDRAGSRVIRAPMVGIFHANDGIIEPNASVSEGQVIGAIESMKLLNDVICDVSGTVAEVMVEDGMPVEYGQPLCAIEVTQG